MLFPLLLSFAAAQADGDMLTPAREGMLRCATPDRVRKSCSSLTRFDVAADGSFEAEVTGIGGPAGITVRYRTPGRLVGGSVCFTQRPDTLAEATFTKPGARLAQSLQDSLRAELAAAMASLNGKQRCYRDNPVGNALVSRTTLDGVVHPELDRTVIWVRPDDGYKVE